MENLFIFLFIALIVAPIAFFLILGFIAGFSGPIMKLDKFLDSARQIDGK